MTASLDITPKTTEQNQIVRTGKYETEVTEYKQEIRSVELGVCPMQLFHF